MTEHIDTLRFFIDKSMDLTSVLFPDILSGFRVFLQNPVKIDFMIKAQIQGYGITELNKINIAERRNGFGMFLKEHHALIRTGKGTGI